MYFALSFFERKISVAATSTFAVAVNVSVNVCLQLRLVALADFDWRVDLLYARFSPDVRNTLHDDDAVFGSSLALLRHRHLVFAFACLPVPVPACLRVCFLL